MDAWLREKGSVELRAFGHLVSGHSLLLELSEDTICKPLLFAQERAFYETMPAAIQQYAPKYHGVAALQIRREKESGGVKLLARYKPEAKADCGESGSETREDGKENPPDKNQHLYLKKECSPSGFSIDASNGQERVNGHRAGPHSADGDASGYQSPWTTFLAGKWRETLLTYEEQQSALDMDCLVLENLTCKYRYPCILDLKMGTRAYKDDDTEMEKKRKTEKYAQTTSLSLGTRICGMQVYDVNKHQFNFKDRIWSRQLTENEFYQALKEFLFNGRCYRRDVVPGLLVMLRGLRDVIRQQDSFRFFTSSLLIVYDGVGREEMEEEKEEEGEWECPIREGGIRNGDGPAVAKTVGCTSQANPVEPTLSDSSGPDLQKLRKQVDVRMIDFARSTHLGMSDQSSYLGPDEGYIQGLTTLISAFESILKSL